MLIPVEAEDPLPAEQFLHLAPLLVNGQAYHRLLLSPATDSLSAVALSERVAEALGTDPGNWVVRRAPLAFLLGEFPSVAEADEEGARLRDLGVPGYVLAVAYSDGREAYRVYAGAYADETDAGHLQGLLGYAGLTEASLEPRLGTTPP